MRTMKKKKKTLSTNLLKRILFCMVALLLAYGIAWLIYYVCHYVNYDGYQKYLSGYEYEEGTEFVPLEEKNAQVEGMSLVCENEYLKLYTDLTMANIAVYDKRDNSVTYACPINADEDSKANKNNKNYLKSQLIVYYYNSDVKSGSYDSYSMSVAMGQFRAERIEQGVRYIYEIGDKKDKKGGEGIYFEIPLEYRLDGDSVVVSIPTGQIKEHGGASVYRIQLLRYMGAASTEETGYLVVPNGSGSLIRFNNGKTTASNYSQYFYGLDPMVSTYTTTENVEDAKLPIWGICRENSAILAEVEKGAGIAVLTAGISGVYNDYNYAYPTFCIRNVDNLRNFGTSTRDVYVLEEDLYDINLTVRYSFLKEEYSGYSGLANYYRNRLLEKGILTKQETGGNIPFYYDIIAGVKGMSHFLGVQYLKPFAMTTFEEAGQIAEDLNESGIQNQVMNLQGWMNGGYYHDTADKIKIMDFLGGKQGLEQLNEEVSKLGGVLYVDTAFMKVTFADSGFPSDAESARYYGAGFSADFGLVNPTTLRNTTSLGYSETMYHLLSPKFLPRYVDKFIKEINKIEVDGISLRDLGNTLTSDKKRSEVINREEAQDIVLGQLEAICATGKRVMTDSANAYAFAYSSDILNVPMEDNSYVIVDESIPWYQMIIHGCISYSTELMNFEDTFDLRKNVLLMIETGTSPHYVFTEKNSSLMKDTGLSRYYATTYTTWKEDAIAVYKEVNQVLKQVSGAIMIRHEILGQDVRKVTYDNGIVIYVNYGSEEQTADGKTLPALSYRWEDAD